jgi:AraC family transcriptional regulator
MDVMQLAAEQAISTMWSRYGEPLSLDELADSAILSKFYFSRVFRTVTGTSPGRFLSAIRLFKAKNLLLGTSLSVTDIAYEVGYNSLGTFTTRFTRSVGLPPGRYRALSSEDGHALGRGRHLLRAGEAGELTGMLRMPDVEPVRVYVAAFASAVVEGAPAACTVLHGSGVYTLQGLPSGTWYIRAAAVDVRDVDPRPWARRPRSVATGAPVTLRPGERRLVPELRLRPATFVDLPILTALPELDNWGVPELEVAA